MYKRTCNHIYRYIGLCLVLLFYFLCGCTGKSDELNYVSIKEKLIHYHKHNFMNGAQDKQDSTILVLATRGDKKGIMGCSFEYALEDNTPINYRIKYKNNDSVVITLDPLLKPSFAAAQSSNSNLVAYFFNRNGDVVHSDTIALPHTREWTELSGEIKTRDCDFFTITIEVQGTSNEAPCALSIMDLSISGLPKVKEREVYPIQSSSISTWEDLLSSPLMDKKILALGETVHGTETLADVAFSLMKERVLHHNCKLLLLELDIESTFALNRYVKNDANFDQNNADYRNRLKGSLFSDSIWNFFDWIKEYNSTHNNEVSLYGVDFAIDLKFSKIDICNFIYSLNKESVSTIVPICEALISPSDELKANDILCMIDSNESLKNKLTEVEYKLLRHCISNWDIKYSADRWDMREDNMAANTIKIIELSNSLNSNPTMYLHSGHASNNHMPIEKRNSFAIFPNSPSMGRQLKKHFADDYASIAITCLRGKTTTFWNDTFVTEKFMDVPESSIEYQMSKKPGSILYLPSKNIPSNTTYHIRYIGNGISENPFRLCDLKVYCDGIILVEEAEPNKKSKEFREDQNIIWFEQYQKMRKKLKALK